MTCKCLINFLMTISESQKLLAEDEAMLQFICPLTEDEFKHGENFPTVLKSINPPLEKSIELE